MYPFVVVRAVIILLICLIPTYTGALVIPLDIVVPREELPAGTPVFAGRLVDSATLLGGRSATAKDMLGDTSPLDNLTTPPPVDLTNHSPPSQIPLHQGMG